MSRRLQCRSWGRTANTVKTRPIDLKSELRLYAGKLIEYYMEMVGISPKKIISAIIIFLT